MPEKNHSIREGNALIITLKKIEAISWMNSRKYKIELIEKRES